MTPGAALRAMRPVKNYLCVVCGERFTASDTRATYCGNRCAQAAKYARKRARRQIEEKRK